MLKWALLLQDEYEEVVGLVLRSECDKLDSYGLLRDLKNSEVVKRNPQKTGELLVYLLQHKRGWIDRQGDSALIQELKAYGIKGNTMQKLDELTEANLKLAPY